MFENKYQYLILDQVYLIDKSHSNMLLNNKISKLEIEFSIKSNSLFIKVFVGMLILLEKQSHTRIKFVLSNTILSTKKYIPIGCVIELCNVSLIRFFHEYLNHNLYRTISNTNKILTTHSFTISFIIKKILFYNIFHFDNDVDLFYDDFDSSIYNLSFIFKTNFNSVNHNKLVMSLHGFHKLNEYKWQDDYLL